jgi:hypothetical protein
MRYADYRFTRNYRRAVITEFRELFVGGFQVGIFLALVPSLTLTPKRRTMTRQSVVSIQKERLHGKALFQQMNDEYDFSNVTWTIQRYNKEITEAKAQEMLQAFLQWFSLAPMDSDDRWITMFQTDVEEAFHAFVLNTALYQDFCSRYLGYFFHHNPLVEEEGPAIESAARYTVESLMKEYGDDLHPMLQEWTTQFANKTYKVACVGPGGRCA